MNDTKPKITRLLTLTKPNKLRGPGNHYEVFDIAIRPDGKMAVALWYGEDPDFPAITVLDTESQKQELLQMDLVDQPIRMVHWPENNDIFWLTDMLNGTTGYKLNGIDITYLGPVCNQKSKVVWALQVTSLPTLDWSRYREIAAGKFEIIDRTGVDYRSEAITTTLQELVDRRKSIIFPVSDYESARKTVEKSFSSFQELADRLALPDQKDDDATWSAYFGKPRSEVTQQDIEHQRQSLRRLIAMGQSANADALRHFEALIRSDICPPQCGDDLASIVQSIKECRENRVLNHFPYA